MRAYLGRCRKTLRTSALMVLAVPCAVTAQGALELVAGPSVFEPGIRGERPAGTEPAPPAPGLLLADIRFPVGSDPFQAALNVGPAPPMVAHFSARRPAPAGEAREAAALAEDVAVVHVAEAAMPRGVLRRSVFRDRQLLFPRVRDAYRARVNQVRTRFLDQGVADPNELFFRVFKREQLMEVWARDAKASEFVLIETYPVCAPSGQLGPKRQEGDEQIPEGFYSIDLFNPVSNFHLSLRVDYPNAVDRFRAGSASPGGEIFIHGGCVTVGCIAVTDAWIEEIYLMAIQARDAGQQRIPVHIFPTRLDADGMAWLRHTFGPDHPDMDFWESLWRGYLLFEAARTVPLVAQAHGRYTFPVDGDRGATHAEVGEKLSRPVRHDLERRLRWLIMHAPAPAGKATS